ncbi:MAG: hypothetical protein Ta2G_10530 [Termitinemataceae bacterium]|nr:MAG: hypothetical protein Ta2G_10530 [Termitinemataceae bacterium]
MWTDTYKYTRTASLRSIERVFHVKENDPETKNIRQTIRFPRLVPKELQEDETNVSTITADSSFLSDIFRNVPAKSVYKTDAKRRVITETRMDGEGGIIGEINNLWNNDRLSVVTWRGKDEERTVEYRYNKAGDRIGEVNYRNGVLERTVELIEGGKELEKLYINNQVILSAIWENGRKLSEERYPIKQVRN